MIWGVNPVKQAMSVHGKPQKVPQPEPSTYGPITASTGDDWGGLLICLANCLGMDKSFLLLQSMEWCWLHQANSMWLPLRDPNGFTSLLKQLKMVQPCSVSTTYIIVCMAEPAWQPVDPSMLSSINYLSLQLTCL